ncbi:glycosyl hydrolase family 18 protein [Xanthobacter sp. DSM 24535]|uniref:glycosyl hydrolase family 18 protein n=1 Tax=Roseixanthobacter psychrophilus TaxID=3119917 RepID=UPI0037267E19
MIALAWLVSWSAAAFAAAPERPFLAYHLSWNEVPASTGEGTVLARLPGYFTHVALSFVKPDLVYAGDLDLKDTGLLFPFSGAVLKAAVAALKARHPGMKVLVSVGSGGYVAWDRFDPDALARLVRDLGADGVDVDFETHDPGCITTSAGGFACAADREVISVIEAIRKRLPRPYVVTLAVQHVGAFGEGAFADAQPRSRYTGSSLGVLRSRVAADIDLVSIMAYDAGNRFRPDQAFRAYRAVWKGPLALGILVLPDTTGGPRFTVDTTRKVLLSVLGDPQAGAMLYGLLDRPPGPIGPDNPDDRYLAATICSVLGGEGCAASIP